MTTGSAVAVGRQGESQAATPTPVRTSLRATLARRLPIVLWMLIVVLSLVEVWMIAVTLNRPAPDQWAFRGFEAALALSFGSVGALIAARRPENRVGWVLILVSVLTGVQGVVDQYPILAAAAVPPLPAGDLITWISTWIWVISAVPFMCFVPLIFPDGRLLSPRWRWAVWLAFAAIAVQVGSIILATEPLGPVPATTNTALYFELAGPRVAAGYLFQVVAIGVAATSMVIRYRRARGDERQQIKWVAYAVAFIPPAAAVGMLPIFIGQFVLVASGAFAAAAIAIAILRYRLYEIDLIINRTLVYGALSAILAGVYTASITLSQRLFTAITGERSDAAIVLTTLIVAATFTPLKTRLQAIVDARLKSAQPVVATATPAASAASDAGDGPWATGAEALALVASLTQLHADGALSRNEYRAKKAELLRRV